MLGKLGKLEAREALRWFSQVGPRQAELSLFDRESLGRYFCFFVQLSSSEK